MDLDIIKIAADTSNNKILEDYTHKSKYKNKTCGDYICLLYTSDAADE